MTEAPAPIAQAATAATNAQIAMSAAWLVVSFLDHSGSRRRLSGEFMDGMKILVNELAAAGYLDRYRDPETGALHLPALETSGVRNYAAESDGTVSRPTLKGTNP